MTCGFLPLDKPAGPSSAGVVARLRRVLPPVRVGHAGTLDPAAEGVLVLGLGRATALLPYLPKDKRYRAVVRLGITTDTLDAAGRILAERPLPPLDLERLERALRPFRGESLQVPPMVSALQVNGQRLYRLARAGRVVERPPRRIVIHDLILLAYDPPDVHLEVHCGPGTYVRSLAADLGETLGCGAHLARLRRTAGSGFDQSETIRLEEAEAPDEGWRRALISPEQALSHWPALTVTGAEERAARHGRALDRPPAGAPEGTLRLMDEKGRLLAMGLHADGSIRMVRVVRPAGEEPACG